MRWFKVPFWIPWVMPQRLWRGPKYDSQGRPCVYLTFDDGPIPEVTPWVLEQLDLYGAKATFFCIGDNGMRHREILQDISAQGHTIGNHTQSHCHGQQTSTEDYLLQTQQFHQSTAVKTRLFRPPYGRLTWAQERRLRRRGYRIIMWDLLSYDWQKELSPEMILEKLKTKVRPGSIIVFHDSLKAQKNLRAVLPEILRIINDLDMAMLPLDDWTVPSD